MKINLGGKKVRGRPKRWLNTTPRMTAGIYEVMWEIESNGSLRQELLTPNN